VTGRPGAATAHPGGVPGTPWGVRGESPGARLGRGPGEDGGTNGTYPRFLRLNRTQENGKGATCPPSIFGTGTSKFLHFPHRSTEG